MARRRKPPRGEGRQRGGWQITAAWQVAAQRRLRDLGWDDKTFAVMMGCAQSTASKMLHGETPQSSALVPRAHELFGWVHPDELQGPIMTVQKATIEAALLFDQLPDEIKAAKYAEIEAILRALPIRPKNDEK